MRFSRQLLFTASVCLLAAGCSSNTKNTLSVNIPNPITTIQAGSAAVTVNATVTNDGTMSPGVTWTLTAGGSACSPTCGTISNPTTTSVTYTPPESVPASPNNTPTITATSNTDNTQSAADPFTITSAQTNPVSLLDGQYAFALEGFDPNGDPLTIAGSFAANGMGTITGGEMDVNDFTSPQFLTGLAGTYTLGADGRGTVTLTNKPEGFASALGFSFTLDTGTNKGQIISLDGNLLGISGFLEQQTGSALATKPTGDFIYRLTADFPQRAGAVGRFTLGADGSLSNGLIDAADVINATFYEDQTLAGGAAIGAPDADGRGTFSLTPTGAVEGSFVYYIVDASHFYIYALGDSSEAALRGKAKAAFRKFRAATTPEVSANALSSYMMVGVARSQNADSLNASSPNGTGTFGIIGGDFDGEQEFIFASVAAGQMAITGGNSITVNADINDADGDDVGQLDAITGSVAFDPTTGRGTITLPDGFNDGFVDSLSFYLEASGTGVLLDTTTLSDGTFPEALVGDLLPYTSTSAISGNIIGVGLISESDIPVTAGAFTASGTNFSGTVDGTEAGEGTLTGQAATGTISGTDSNGRITGMVTSTVFGTNLPYAAYAVGPKEMFLIGVDPESTSSLGVFAPQVLPSQAGARPVTKPAAKGAKAFAKPGRLAAAATRASAGKVHVHGKR